MARYENIIVINPDFSKEEEDELLKRITTNMEKASATVAKLDDWGVRKLAYPIKKKDRGHYFFYLLDMPEQKVAGLGKFYRTVDGILRHMFVVIDEAKKVPEKAPDQVIFDDGEGDVS
ncbi:MAG TPA: 30S ribosomal protein S6 [Syntrophorhabdaceae bacterium]